LESYLKEMTSNEFTTATDRTGRVASTQAKHIEYIVCAAIVIASRAAMDAGIDAGSAYALSDIYSQKLEKSRNVMEMLRLCQTMMLEFAARVKRFRQARSASTYVEASKSFIDNHLNKPFTLEDVAETVHITKPYLSKLFMEQEGVSVMDYARGKRVAAAANLLRYSDESISNIANYLCFPSQSYFGSVFKKAMGMTPNRYREQNKLIDVASSVGRG
jgi:AraC-like DNA-binding protein